MTAMPSITTGGDYYVKKEVHRNNARGNGCSNPVDVRMRQHRGTDGE